MKITNKQKVALEKITGKAWGTWHPEAVMAYFAYTDRGQTIDVSNGAQSDRRELQEAHHWHSVTVEMWKKDFRVGLLFLDDFIDQDYPKAYIKHVFEIYRDAMGFIPSKYAQVESEL